MILKHDYFKLLDKIVLQRMIFKSPFQVGFHMVDEACFMHVLKGHSRLYSHDQHLSIKPSDSFVMKCGTYFNNWLKKEIEEPNEAIVVHFFPDVLRSVFEDEFPDFLNTEKPRKNIQIEAIEISEMISNYVQSLLHYFKNPSLVSDELIKLKLKELIYLLVNTEDSDRIKSMLSDMFRPNHYQFKEVIDAHLFEDLRISDLAYISGFSLSSFKRKFHKVFGMSPAQYIKKKRLEKAKELLEHTDMRISEIAFDCGFNDLGYFSKCFTAAFHLPPREYRNTYLSKH